MSCGCNGRNNGTTVNNGNNNGLTGTARRQRRTGNGGGQRPRVSAGRNGTTNLSVPPRRRTNPNGNGQQPRLTGRNNDQERTNATVRRRQNLIGNIMDSTGSSNGSIVYKAARKPKVGNQGLLNAANGGTDEPANGDNLNTYYRKQQLFSRRECGNFNDSDSDDDDDSDDDNDTVGDVAPLSELPLFNSVGALGANNNYVSDSADNLGGIYTILLPGGVNNANSVYNPDPDSDPDEVNLVGSTCFIGGPDQSDLNGFPLDKFTQFEISITIEPSEFTDNYRTMSVKRDFEVPIFKVQLFLNIAPTNTARDAINQGKNQNQRVQKGQRITVVAELDFNVDPKSMQIWTADPNEAIWMLGDDSYGRFDLGIPTIGQVYGSDGAAPVSLQNTQFYEYAEFYSGKQNQPNLPANSIMYPITFVQGFPDFIGSIQTTTHYIGYKTEEGTLVWVSPSLSEEFLEEIGERFNITF